MPAEISAEISAEIHTRPEISAEIHTRPEISAEIAAAGRIAFWRRTTVACAVCAQVVAREGNAVWYTPGADARRRFHHGAA